MGTYHRWEDFPQRVANQDTFSYLAGRPDSEIRFRILSTERIMLTEIKVHHGATVPRHHHEAEQIIIIQKGEARVTTGKEESPHVLKEGDIWIVPSNTLHGVEYLGEVEALEIVSPPRMDNFIGYTIKKTFFEDDDGSK